MDHKLFAYVYTCYDPKILNKLIEYCDECFGKGNYIFDADPGAVKNLVSPSHVHALSFVLWKMKLAHEKVHLVDIFLLINHSLCGAYAADGATFDDRQKEMEFHTNELQKAEKLVTDNFPAVPIETHFFLKEEQKMAW